MLIQHSNRSTAGLNHGGETYETLGEGVFEVPDQVAQELTAFPHWNVFHGEHPGGAADDAEDPDSGAVDWYEAGRAAHASAHETGAVRAAPEGQHARSRAARDYLRGWDSVTVPPEPAPAK